MGIQNVHFLVALSAVVFHIEQISGSVSLSYLRNVRRLNSVPIIDHYFCCNTHGETLQWGVNGESVCGFSVQDVGRVIDSVMSNYTTSSSLLSVKMKPDVPNRGIFDSVLIVSVEESSNLYLSVYCTNGTQVESKNITQKPEYTEDPDDIATSDNREVIADYIVAAPIVMQSSNLTHIFVCASNRSLVIGLSADRYSAGFGLHDSVGRTRKEINNNTTNFLAVLGARHPLKAITFAFVTTGSSFTLQCVDETNTVQLQSRDRFIKTTSDTFQTTSAMEHHTLYKPESFDSVSGAFAAMIGPTSLTYTIGCIIVMVLVVS